MLSWMYGDNRIFTFTIFFFGNPTAPHSRIDNLYLLGRSLAPSSNFPTFIHHQLLFSLSVFWIMSTLNYQSTFPVQERNPQHHDDKQHFQARRVDSPVGRASNDTTGNWSSEYEGQYSSTLFFNTCGKLKIKTRGYRICCGCWDHRFWLPYD